MLSQAEQDRRMTFAREAVAKTSTKVIDPELAEEFARILVVEMYAPHLGCAKTSELLAEVAARSREEATIDEATV